MAKNIIELNGKRYDAVSGAIVGKAAQPSTKRPRQVDSFVRHQPGSPTASHAKSQPATVADPVTVKLAPHRTSPPAQHISAHQPQHPQTLMRRAVQKPTVAAPTKLKVVAPTASASELVKPSASFHKVSVSNVSQLRLERSQQVSQTQAIKRFSNTPAIHTPVATVVQPSPAAQAPISSGSSAGSQRSKALFEQAMANATSHQQTYQPKPGRHGLSRGHVAILASAFAVIFLAGFLMYHSIPSMDLNVASAKAGFRASMPGYQPAGFSLGHLTYGPGSVTINYHSNSDDRKFSVVEKTSSWDSSILLANFVKTNSQPYQSYQVGGRTVYLYGDNNGTWVDGGIWYVVNGDTALSNNQILQMAGSI